MVSSIHFYYIAKTFTLMTIEKQFPAGMPVSGTDLIGREREFKALLNTLANGQSVLLIAPRRLGKTSLALEVLKKLQDDGHFIAEVDIFNVISKREFAEKIVGSALKNKKLPDLFNKLKTGLAVILKNVQLKQVVEDFEFILDFGSSSADENKLFENSLEFLNEFSAKHKKHIFVLLDEFGDVTKLDGEDILKKMRAIIQRQQNATYLFAGSQESVLKHIFGDKKSPFFRFAATVELGNLPMAETVAYIKRKFTSLGFKIDGSVANEIVGFTEGHPYYTQLLCQKIYLGIKGAKEVVGIEDVKEGLDSVIVSERQYFEELWQRLRERKHHVLIAKNIAEGGSPYNVAELDKQTIYNSLITLERSGIIKKIDKARYKLVDPFFKRYIIREADTF